MREREPNERCVWRGGGRGGGGGGGGDHGKIRFDKFVIYEETRSSYKCCFYVQPTVTREFLFLFFVLFFTYNEHVYIN